MEAIDERVSRQLLRAHVGSDLSYYQTLKLALVSAWKCSDAFCALYHGGIAEGEVGLLDVFLPV